MNGIVFITTGWFPEGDAGAVRLRMMANCITEAGYHVTVLCRGKENDRGTVDGIDYISLRHLKSKFGKAYDYLVFPLRVKRFLKKNADSLYGVYIYNAHISVFEICKRFCRHHGIRLFHDCVEWYSPEEFKKGDKDSRYRNKLKINTKVVDNSFFVISISKYLEKYFASRGINTLRVPVLCDPSIRTEPKKRNGEKLTLFYAGIPYGKDLIDSLLKATFLLSDEERKRLKIVLVGTTKEAFANGTGMATETLDRCSDYVEFVGRVPRSDVIRLMEEADFTVLIRDASLTYAKAGFPSKVTESLSNATPILCNLSSDLEEYLEDGENAVISKDHTPEAVADAVRRAILLTPEEKNAMSKKALETSRDRLDYRQYVEKIANFLK